MEILINRPEQQQDHFRNYRLYADGKKLTTLKPNSTIKLKIPDDTEYIQAKVDWCSSPKLYISDIKSYTIVVKNTLEDNLSAGILAALDYITFGRKLYLTIESQRP